MFRKRYLTFNFVQEFGERYLLVDALRIIQDNPAGLQAQIENMNIVYGKLTTVAAAGSNPNAGLPGSAVRPRKLLDICVVVDDVHLIAALPSFTSSIYDSVWESAAGQCKRRYSQGGFSYLLSIRSYITAIVSPGRKTQSGNVKIHTMNYK